MCLCMDKHFILGKLLKGFLSGTIGEYLAV